ncbi:DUF523 and DUF1722 domain-containing protein [Photobacterium sp.]|uniref:YbgA family protein n=1 Tax=Photobacterium sp. TaxID=660 RepID=UPI00299D4164|nr:DUF523 and DUF1722 domain-containing protein [Photobacterium sp.]MDX1301437.1 DUF523 and DUF1722 domain-containing protein [Photobacterium sp.]
MRIPVGISACVLGQNVRFDGGHKRNRFVAEDLAQYFQFQPVCPEVGIGLPTPRPAIRLLDMDGEQRLVGTKDASQDHTQKMMIFSDKKIPQLQEQELCGYIVCAKSPTCGMERVKLYMANGNTIPGGTTGIFTRKLMEKMPWLPVEEDGRLQDPVLRENFVFRVFALHDLYQSLNGNLTREAIVKFHSRYKLVLMAHNLTSYQSLGQLVAAIKEWDIEEFFIAYRLQFMTAIKHKANNRTNTNVLMHMQGYFKRLLDKEQKAELTALIINYRKGHLPLLAPVTLFKHYLQQHPNEYLQSQRFLNPYPEELKLRYSL